MPAVANQLALLTLRQVRHGYAQWEPCHLLEHGWTYNKAEPQAHDYAGFARYELLTVPGVLDAIVQQDGGLRVVFDPYLVSQVPHTWEAQRALEMATCRLLSICVRHGLALIDELEV